MISWRDVDLALEEALKLLVNRLNPLGVYLFGSQALRTSRPESDLDLAVLGEKPYDPWELFQVASLLSRLVSREVDLVDLRQAPLALQAQVAAFGQALNLRRSEAERFLDLALKAYARLNEERADLIQDILKRGLVYG
jgi:predicted nucleotidyltransferase